MPMEIERKFLIKSDGWKKLPLIKVVEIKQGYILNTKSKTVRVRVTQDQAFITIKAAVEDKKGLIRREFEYEIPHGEGQELLDLCTDTVDKTRHILRDDKNQVWEVDLFKKHLRGLKVVEIELPDEKQQVHLHPWIGDEVTDDHRYTNAYLSTHKAPKD